MWVWVCLVVCREWKMYESLERKIRSGNEWLARFGVAPKPSEAITSEKGMKSTREGGCFRSPTTNPVCSPKRVLPGSLDQRDAAKHAT